MAREASLRIAISGVHRTGKTTLVRGLADALPDHLVVDEPYYLLEDEGYAFADPPSLEDFERQLERSIALVLGADKNTILDRSPADFLGYLLAHDEAAAFDADAWLGDVEEAMARLDLVVFCSIERPDRIGVEAAGRAWRRRVDGDLRDIIMGDRWNWQIATVEVAGDPDDRVRQVVAAIEAG